MRIRPIGLVVVVAFATQALIACATSTEQGAVGVDRSQLFLVSSSEMDQAAASQYQQLLQTESPKGNVNHDLALAKRLIPQTAVFRKDALEWILPLYEKARVGS